jgi:hypothetical protein
MRKLGLVVVVALSSALLAPSAFADQAPLKLSNLNFGDQTIGSRTYGTITVTNRSDQPVQLYSVGFTAPSDPFGFDAEEIATDECASLVRRGVPLPADGSCAVSVFFVPPEPGTYRWTLCANEFYCTVIRGHA